MVFVLMIRRHKAIVCYSPCQVNLDWWRVLLMQLTNEKRMDNTECNPGNYIA